MRTVARPKHSPVALEAELVVTIIRSWPRVRAKRPNDLITAPRSTRDTDGRAGRPLECVAVHQKVLGAPQVAPPTARVV